MRLSESLASATPSGLFMRALTDPVRLNRAVRAIDARWPDVTPNPPERDRDRLGRELLRRVREGDWRDCRLSFVAAAARAVFDDKRRNDRMFDDARAFLIRELVVTSRRGLKRAMFQIYLETYEPGASHTRAIGAVLNRIRSSLPSSLARLVTTLPEILDETNAAHLLALRMHDAPSPYEMLRAAYLSAPHGAGLMDHAHDAFIRRLRPDLDRHEAAAFARMLAWLAPPGAEKVKTRGAEVAVAAMLRPWRNEVPPASIRTLLIESLVSAYGDPRLQRSGMWGALADEDRAIFMRWLVGATLKAFLEIVSEAEDSHMWAPRREFWLDLYERGAIAEAWVALSRRGAEIAARRAREAQDDSLRAYGRQIAGGSRVNTSLLIMRIGNKIVIEGSHNYMVHIFKLDHPQRPALYLDNYDCERIRLSLGANDKRVHDVGGNWRRWVMERVL